MKKKSSELALHLEKCQNVATSFEDIKNQILLFCKHFSLFFRTVKSQKQQGAVAQYSTKQRGFLSQKGLPECPLEVQAGKTKVQLKMRAFSESRWKPWTESKVVSKAESECVLSVNTHL